MYAFKNGICTLGEFIICSLCKDTILQKARHQNLPEMKQFVLKSVKNKKVVGLLTR